MKKLLKKLFINFILLDICWNPFNGGQSYSFGIYLLGFGTIVKDEFKYLFLY